MKISLFLEIPVPRPWDERSELDAFQEHLDLCELADKLGFHAVWVTEHHFLEEYCHASAPEIFLAAVSQRTRHLRLGHGIAHMPPNINHPARVAERIATLDLISNGRVEFGTGESSSVAELDGFRVDPGKKREMWEEAIRVAISCMADTPFPGFKGEFVDMPPRNVVPKPLQKPHPPVWIACTKRATIAHAARNGIGALSFSHLGPEAFRPIVEEYYSILESDECVPVARAVNANTLSIAGGMVCASDGDTAEKILGNKARFFSYGIGHYYLGTQHKPGVTDLWAAYEQGMADDTVPGSAERERNLVGGPERLREYLRRYEETGVDEVILLAPPIHHDDLMASFELFGTDVLPEFHDRDAGRVEQKMRRLAPAIEAAMDRRPPVIEVDPEYQFGGIASSWDNQTPISEIVESISNNVPDEKYLKGASAAIWTDKA